MIPSVGRVARRVLRTPLGVPVGRAAYRVAARAAALALAQVPGVDAVYAAGSLAHPAALQPGYSDVDLVLLVSVPTLDAELDLRDGVERVQRRANRFGALFGSIDYIESRDVNLFRRHGNAWWSDVDRRCRRLAGAGALDSSLEPAPRHRQLQSLAENLRRWQKASAWLLDPTLDRERFAVERDATRFLADFLSTLVDGHRHDSLARLLERVRGDAGVALSALKVASHAGTLSPDPVVLVSAALEALERHAADVTSSWRPASPGAAGSRGADPEAERVRGLAATMGFASVCVAERAPSDRVLFVVSAGEERSTDVVARHRVLLRDAGTLPPARFPWISRPVVVTPALFGAAWVFQPSLGDPSNLVETAGAPLPELRVPPPEEQAILERAFRLSWITRARGRRFRAGRTPAAADRGAATALFRLTGGGPAARSERELVDTVRRALEGERRTV